MNYSVSPNSLTPRLSCQQEKLSTETKHDKMIINSDSSDMSSVMSSVESDHLAINEVSYTSGNRRPGKRPDKK